MSDPRDLTTIDAVKLWLPGMGNTNVSDDVLQSLITSCSVFMQNEMQVSIAQASYSETRNGTGGSRMLVKNSPIASVSSVTIDGIAIPARGALGVNGTPYGFIFDDISVMLSGGCFPVGYGNVAFAYLAGYSSVPPDLAQACNDLIGDWFKYRDRIGSTSQGIEGQTTSFTDIPIPKRARGVMNNYMQRAPIAS